MTIFCDKLFPDTQQPNQDAGGNTHEKIHYDHTAPACYPYKGLFAMQPV